MPEAQVHNLPAERHSLKEVAIADHGLGAHLVPQSMADVVRFAEVMAKGAIAIRKHLRGDPGACLAVTLQALDWGMNPIAVANKSYAVNDQLAYEAQLIAAVVHSRAPIKGRPRYTYTGGPGTTRKCHVEVTTLEGELLDYTSPEVAKITTKNSPLWKSDEDQQLGYFSIRSLARRHFPELLLGVYDREEAAAMRDVTPRGQPEPSGLAARLAAGKSAGNEGFTAATAEQTPHDPQTGEVIEAEDAHFVDNAEEIAREGAAEVVAGADDQAEVDANVADAMGATEPADDFPGDRADDEAADSHAHPARAWAQALRDDLDADGFESVATLDAFTSAPDNARYFGEFEAIDAEGAKRLNAQIKGTRKALLDRERSR